MTAITTVVRTIPTTSADHRKLQRTSYTRALTARNVTTLKTKVADVSDDFADPAKSDILAQAENEMNQAWEALYPRVDGHAKLKLIADQDIWTKEKDSSCFEGRKVHVNCQAKLIAARREYLTELSLRVE